MNLQHSPEFPQATALCECRAESPPEHARDAGYRRRLVQALSLFASPAMRLHRMRDVHTKMLRDALCQLDGPDRPGTC